MEIIAMLSLAIGASWCAGINLYATVAVLGLMHRYTGFELPAGMEVLASNIVLWPAIALYCVEFFADKIPGLDTTWDTIQTFLRVPAGAVLAAMALGNVPEDVQLLAVMLGGAAGGALALGSHCTKATCRLAAHSTGTSPVVSPTASLAEDAIVVGTLGAVAAYPTLALFLLFVMIAVACFVTISLWKIATTAFRTIYRPKAPVANV